MSLFGALSTGGSSLAAQQAALQVTGNNISNAGTAGYTREVANLQPNGETPIGNGLSTGDGVTVGSVQRQVDASLNESLRSATSDQSGAQSLQTSLNQLQTTFGALNDNDLASQLSTFFSSASSLTTNPTDTTQRQLLIQNGVTLTQYMNNLRSQVTTVQTNNNAQIGTLAQQANSLLNSITALNKQINQSQNPKGANSLFDLRDQDLTKLSQLMNITVNDQGAGNLSISVAGNPILQGTSSRGITTKQTADPTGTFQTTSLVFADNGDPINVSGGQLGGLVNAQNNFVIPAIQTVDSIANGLISAVNNVSTQGQGITGFSTVTGTTTVTDPTLPLNTTPATQTGIYYPPTNGTFNLSMTDATTGAVTTQQINVNLSGQGTQTTLNSLAASITAAGGGVVSATVNPAGNLVIASNNSNVTFGFGNDTSGTLAALGINTFFTGNNAANIAVNPLLQQNQNYLATAQLTNNGVASNANIQLLAAAGDAAVSSLNGQSITNTYTNYIGSLAISAQNADDDVTATGAIQSGLSNQQQAISGVSLDEETINMLQYQRAFQGSAQFISTVDQMLQTILAMIPA